MVVPNEKVASSIIFNRSTGDRSAPASVSVWVPPDADLDEARAALEDLEVSSVDVAEITTEGVRIEVHGASDPARTVTGARRRPCASAPIRPFCAAGLLDAWTCKTATRRTLATLFGSYESAGTQKAAALWGVAG